MKAEDILKEAKQAIAEKHDYPSWSNIIHDFFDGNVPAQFLEECEDESSLLAMSKVAEQTNGEWREQRARLIGQNEDLTAENEALKSQINDLGNQL